MSLDGFGHSLFSPLVHDMSPRMNNDAQYASTYADHEELSGTWTHLGH